ncbi:Scr1 family TA system antitoxin-like transcriptional regulator [Streptomyces carpaticus]|uniref:Scr1 family TA system antitoxin-like transcriptional regulator n=1 Tax=Streptomyces carpaticus TaxID=285558 RepID=UPI0031F9482A
MTTTSRRGAPMRAPARHNPLMTGAEIGRYLLGDELLRLRQAAGLRQQDAARAGVSASRLSQAERGLVSLPTSDIARLLNLYGAGRTVRTDVAALRDAIPPDPADGEEAVADVRDRGSGRWARLATTTNRAEGLTEVSTGYLPPRVQTAEYATALIRERATGAAPDVVMAMTGRCGAARGDVVITQPVLGREVGGPRVMAAQLEHLARLASRPGPVTVRVIPLGVVPTVCGLLRLLTPSPDHPGVVVRVHPAHVTYHVGALTRITVRHLLEHAADPAWSGAMIRAAARRYGGAQ